MPPQPSGNRSQFAGDDSTRVLAPVGRDDSVRYVVGRSGVKGRNYYRQVPWQSGFEQDAANIRSDFDKALTAVIPVTPAQPSADWGKPELPDCKKRSMTMCVLFGAGVVAGLAIAAGAALIAFGWWVVF